MILVDREQIQSGWMCCPKIVSVAVKVTIVQLKVAHANLALAKVVGGEVAQAVERCPGGQRRRTGTSSFKRLARKPVMDQVTRSGRTRDTCHRWRMRP